MPRRWLPLVLAALAVLTAPSAGGADPPARTAELGAANTRLAAEARSTELGLYALDSRLAHTEARLGGLAAEQAALARERASVALRLHIARAGLGVAQRRLAGRLRELYEQGDVSSIDILLGASTLDEAVNGLDTLDRVRGQDERVLAQLHSARTDLSAARRRFAAREHRLEAAARNARANAASLRQVRTARAAFIADLARRRALNAQAIDRLESQARAAQARTRALSHRTPNAAAPAPVAVAAHADVASPVVDAAAVAVPARTLTVTASGYSLAGRTASGIPVGWGVAAVDPSVIPLGTSMTVPGYGVAVAADTGGAVAGATIDLWFPTQAQAQAWGRRTVTVTLG